MMNHWLIYQNMIHTHHLSNKKKPVSNVTSLSSLKLCMMVCIRYLRIWIFKRVTGYANIHSELLKVGTLPLSGTWCNLINYSIAEWKFPDILKFAEVSARYRKSYMLYKENYRPVSIHSMLSKVFEKVYCKQMVSYFNDIFSKFLSGLRKKCGCQSTLLRMVENWKSAIEAGELVGTVVIGLSKACDSLLHLLLTANMMTSSNGNIFRVTSPLCREFTGHRWIPRTKASDALMFSLICLNKQLWKQSWGWWFETPSLSLWRHCNERNWLIMASIYQHANWLPATCIIVNNV